MALSLTAIQEKNKLGADSLFALLLEINIPGVPQVTITNNGDEITWDSRTWIPFPFEISELSEEASGEIPQWTITLDNRQRVIEKYLSDYDYYLKANGIDGNQITCTLHIINTKEAETTVLFDDLVSLDAVAFLDGVSGTTSSPAAIKSVYFELQSPNTNAETATFIMAANSPFNIIAPKRRFIKNYCYWKFKGIECAYAGVGTSCDKSLSQCKAYGNSARFGGFPGVGIGGIRL